MGKPTPISSDSTEKGSNPLVSETRPRDRNLKRTDRKKRKRAAREENAARKSPTGEETNPDIGPRGHNFRKICVFGARREKKGQLRGRRPAAQSSPTGGGDLNFANVTSPN